MSTNNNGWNRISEQENRSTKRKETFEKVDTAMKTVGNVAEVITIVCIAVVCIVALAIIGLFK